MKQVEFEQKLKELRAKKNAEVQPLQVLHEDLKARKAAKMQVINELQTQYYQLEAERSVIGKRINAIQTEYNKRIEEFTRENFETTRSLENVSEWTLVKEMKKRGYCGSLRNAEKSDDFIEHLNIAFNSVDVDIEDENFHDEGIQHECTTKD